NGSHGGYGERSSGGNGGTGGEEERRRILAALDANNWRRQDTANTLGISRKVLWEKMRKYQIADGETELRELE
ncbi:helix-turn-helix domain-containing protein, partial [Ralstonia sp.]|uniref:helix-turn-helix domain-containing protein n=1 Tax=Ralstonia sp. TaxID=54061 RepID=UPI0031E038CB